MFQEAHSLAPAIYKLPGLAILSLLPHLLYITLPLPLVHCTQLPYTVGLCHYDALCFYRMSRLCIGLFGDAGVGKSTLISQVCGGRSFTMSSLMRGQLLKKPSTFIEPPTIEDEIFHVINGTPVTLLDTAGIESYRFLWHGQIKRCSIILVIFDTSHSLDVAQMILNIERNCPAVLVNNDRLRNPSLTQASQQIANDHGIDLFCVPAFPSIDSLFTMATQMGSTSNTITNHAPEVGSNPTPHNEPRRMSQKNRRLRWFNCHLGRLVRRLKFWHRE